MGNEKFTKGPWKIYNCRHAETPGIDGADGQSVVVFGTPGELCGVLGKNNSQSWANARLISKAPEMYKSLRMLTEFIRHDISVDTIRDGEEYGRARDILDSIDNA